MLGISILVVLYVYDAGISPNAAVVLNEYPMTRIVPERVSNFPFFSTGEEAPLRYSLQPIGTHSYFLTFGTRSDESKHL